MSKFIDAYKFREMMDHEYPFDKYTQTHYPALDEAKSAVLKILDSCPAVEVEPVRHGHWIDEEIPLPLSDGSKKCVRCSECGTHWEYKFNYCPNCGVKMDE